MLPDNAINLRFIGIFSDWCFLGYTVKRAGVF
jgi:hypothetical protein